MCPCCSQDPKQIHTHTKMHMQTHTDTQPKDRAELYFVLHDCYDFMLYKLCRRGASHTRTHTNAIARSVRGWLQCLDMECEDARDSSRQRKQQGCFWGFWLFHCVWEDGCDNCYLGGEQRKQLHQGKAGHP